LASYLQQSRIDVLPIQLRGIHNLPVCNKGDVIIHLAGKAHDLKNHSSKDEYYKVNYELTKKLYDHFLASSAAKFIFISSVKAVADYTEEPLTEMQKANPQTDYGKSKLMAEEYIMSMNALDKTSLILRPCMIHGPGNKGNLNLLYNLVKRGIPYPLTAFNNKRSFLSIDNLCFVIRELIEQDTIPSGIYNIADDVPLSTTTVVELINEELGKKGKFLKISKRIVWFIAKLGNLLKLPINSENLQKLTEDFIVDNTKLMATIKKTLPLSAEKGLRKSIRSFVNQGDKETAVCAL
jgi:nucleoside-diphosphate-sugar epimerase